MYIQNNIQFDWDYGNETKCRKHGLTVADIEYIFTTHPRVAPDIKHSNAETRFIAVGRAPNNRPAFVAFTLRAGKIRPISARYMHAREVRKYETDTGA